MDLSEAKHLGIRDEKLQELVRQFVAGELVRWSPDERGLPNELLHCAIFSARNRKEPRKTYTAKNRLVLDIIGRGRISYWGEELRQDDESVWMQLVHLAKEARSEWVEFRKTRFVTDLKWLNTSESYERLATSIRRLIGANIEVYNQRFDRGLNTRLLDLFEIAETPGKPWRVHVFRADDKLLYLFETMYTRIGWNARLALPDGIATWLHAYFASHRDPYPIKIETLAKGAGLKLDAFAEAALPEKERVAKRLARLREAKKIIRGALAHLVRVGFLVSFKIESGLVHVVRARTAINSY